jgi:hypothetical protein
MERIQDVTAEHLGAGGEPDGGERMVWLFREACWRYAARERVSDAQALEHLWNEGAFIEPMYRELTQDEIRGLEGPAEEVQG